MARTVIGAAKARDTPQSNAKRPLAPAASSLHLHVILSLLGIASLASAALLRSRQSGEGFRSDYAQVDGSDEVQEEGLDMSI